MHNSSETTPSLSFPEAIAVTQSLMEKMNNRQVNELEIEKAIASLVNTKNGARGFFVAYLTSEMTLADNPTVAVIKALKTAPEVISELLVKNLAMSSAMAVTHRRGHDQIQAQNSERVTKRTANLIRLVNLDLITVELNKLQATIATGQGEYGDFLKRWGYDRTQQEVIEQAIISVSAT
ncbi:MAG: hypothetical protein ACFCU5_17455 [Pleurocapsa sp.]